MGNDAFRDSVRESRRERVHDLVRELRRKLVGHLVEESYGLLVHGDALPARDRSWMSHTVVHLGARNDHSKLVVAAPRCFGGLQDALLPAPLVEFHGPPRDHLRGNDERDAAILDGA